MNRVKSAGIIVYRLNNNQREYLVLQYAHGHWDFAKGKLEQGETEYQAAHRELFEEAGITAAIHPGFEESFSYLFVDHDGLQAEKTVTFFVGRAHEGAIILSDEHSGYRWCSYEDAITQLTYQNAQELIARAQQFLDEKE